MKKNQGMTKEEMIKKSAWLGQFVAFHQIGEYSFVEYRSTVFEGCSPVVPRQYEKKSSFTAFINGRSTSTSYNSLDEALAGTIATKWGGGNSQAGYNFSCSSYGERISQYISW